MISSCSSGDSRDCNALVCIFVPLPQPPVLKAHEVHLWRATLDLDSQRIQKLRETLSTDEDARAARMRFQKDRDHCIAARGILRTILGRYLSMDPREVRFCYSSRGKPALTNEFDGEAPRFNLTHSNGVALYAFARHRELGVDLERIHHHWTGEQVAEQFFAPQEAAVLRGLPPHERQAAFLRLWTRKEALIKARGGDLSFLSQQSGAPQTLTGRAPMAGATDPEDSPWSIHELTFDPDYAAALVVEGQNWQLQCWQWPDAA